MIARRVQRPILNGDMRRLIKFLHLVGVIGLVGATARLLLLLRVTPAPTSLQEYALMRAAMGALPSGSSYLR
jgi:hypothetical protein